MKQTLAIVLVLALLAGCNGKKSEAITSLQERNETVLQVRALTANSFAKLLAEEDLDKEDKENARRALPLVKKVIDFSPNEPENYVLLARTQWLLGETSETQKNLGKAIAIQQKYHTSSDVIEAEAHHDLARLAIMEGKWDVGGQEVAASLKLFPAEPRYLVTQASVMLQAKDVEGARKNAALALKGDPQNSQALSMLKLIQASEKTVPAKAGS